MSGKTKTLGNEATGAGMEAATIEEAAQVSKAKKHGPVFQNRLIHGIVQRAGEEVGLWGSILAIWAVYLVAQQFFF